MPLLARSATIAAQPTMTAEIIGRTLSHYRVKSRLGSGGMGVVYEAEDTTLANMYPAVG